MSDLLNSASLVMIPSGYKEDTVYSVVPSDGSGDLSFTRASNGTRVNSAGLVEVCPWNLVEQSQSFSTSGGAWNYTAGSGVTTGQTGYDGTSNAVLFTDSGANAVYGAYQSFSKLGAVTLSIYAKAGSTNIFNIDIFQTPLATVRVNLSTGAITSGSGVVESVGNGWYRISVTAVMTDSYYVRFGCPATGTVYIQNIQANIGSTAKPYFPTTDRLNVPRLTYQNGGGGCPSLLLEKQSTNLMYPSEDFTNVNWVASNLTITANDATSPDGTQNADKFVTTSTTIENQVRFGTFAILGNVGSSYTVSVFAKKGTADFLRIRNLFTQDGATSGNAWFNLSTGAVGTVQASQTASIQNMGNGWYRCILTGVVGSSNNYNFVDIGFTNTDGANWPSTSVNGYVYGAQLEASSYPTSYIVSTSSSATRVADACFKTGISSLIGQTEGTIFVNWNAISSNSSGRAMTINDYPNTSYNNRIAIINDAGVIRVFISNGGTVQYDESNLGTFVGTHKMAIAYKSDDLKVYIDGVAVSSKTSGFNVPTCSAVSVGTFENNSDDYPIQGTILQSALFKTRLTNAELASLTTI